MRGDSRSQTLLANVMKLQLRQWLTRWADVNSQQFSPVSKAPPPSVAGSGGEEGERERGEGNGLRDGRSAERRDEEASKYDGNHEKEE